MTEPFSTAATAIAAAKAARPAARAVRRLIVAMALVVALCLVCVGGTTLALLGGLFDDSTAAYANGCGSDNPVDPNAQLPDIARLNAEQVHNAAVVIAVAQQLKVPPRGWVIGIATALQESVLTNLPNLGANNDHDSIGLFQQRPSQGWGTPEQLADPAYQSRKFFEKMLAVDGWNSLPLTVVAQAVQRSAYPDAYAKHEPFATEIVNVLTGGGGRAVGTVLDLRCVDAGEITASGWTIPAKGLITSGFRTADRPGHNGADIGVPKGTRIHAAADGIVILVRCDAHIGSQPYSCDRDGGLAVSGCGWYVEILHADNIITRYCHQMRRPSVVVGQSVAAGGVIGLSGSSGNSSGPHIHFEVHVDGDASSRGAVDPVAFMNQMGAPLGAGQE